MGKKYKEKKMNVNKYVKDNNFYGKSINKIINKS